MANLSTQKISVFTNINDLAVAPTVDKAGNGSYFIEQYNYLIDILQGALDAIEADTAFRAANPPVHLEKWTPITDGLNLLPSQNVFLHGTITGAPEQTIVLYFNPGFNASVKVFNGSNCNIRILLYGVYAGQTVDCVYIDANTNKEVGFIWVNADINWISTEPTLVRVVI